MLYRDCWEELKDWLGHIVGGIALFAGIPVGFYIAWVFTHS